eukprot:CAMPEP_0113443650 /NCGR_PEP_ID=MMETSP0014_2-20120614/2251_1 /TAXON_ID=2857 /ORGANISM="Nitzschia sp." /LENGTH=748 /DNA_ID=CAMNT_0000334619 /DNA_START=170 /DNA_END=2416 /DNA_ORIENTATION=- /assembly_acc=CAM_ASM_000159
MVSLKSLDMLGMPPGHIIDGVVSNLEAAIPSVAAAAGSSSASGGSGGKSNREHPHGQGTLITVTVPSLSLFNNQEDCDNGVSTSNTTLSRDDIQLQTAECMSRPIRFDMKKKNVDDEVKECPVAADLKQQRLESQTEELALQAAATQMLEGCIESMDQLVDARLSAYSKILRQHYDSKKNGNANDHDEDDTNNHNNKMPSHHNNVVDFKLRTLLGLGTNISFDSILLNVRTDPGSESRMPMKPQVQKENQEQKQLDVKQTSKSSMEKPIVLEVVINGLSIGGDKQQQQQEEQPEGKDSINNKNSNHGNSYDTSRHLQQHAIRLEAPGMVLVQKRDEKNLEVPAETETEAKAKANEGNTNAGNMCNVSTTPAKTNDNNSVLQLDTPSTPPNHAIHGLRKQMQEQMQKHHAPCTFQEEQTRQEQQLESALETRPTAAAVTTSSNSIHTDNRENCEGGNHKHKQSAIASASDASESSFCSYSLTVQVDTTKLLAAMMDEAEKIVGRVVEITNDAWNQQQEEKDQARKNSVAGAEAGGLAAASSSSSSISPKLGAKTVSEASFVPLNVAIMDRKHAAELEEKGEKEAQQAPAEEKQSIAAGVSAASAVAVAHLPPPPPPPESPNSSSNGSKKRSLHGYGDSNNDNMENYSPIDPAAAERASNIVDFVFGEIEFVTPPPLVSPSTTSSSTSTFRLSPVRKKMKHPTTAESPSPLCLSSIPSQPPPPAAALPPVPSLPATTTSTSSIRTGNSTN